MKPIEATFEHLNELVELFDAYRVFYEKSSDKRGAAAFLMDRISKQDSKIFIILSEEGKGVGFVQLYPLFSSTRMARLWLLNDLFVHPEHRGKGHSVQLIEKAKTLAADTHAAGLMLETAKSNMVGNQLYPRTGFVLDTAHNYYSWDNPAFV